MRTGNEERKLYYSIKGGKIARYAGHVTDKSQIQSKCPEGATPRDVTDKNSVYKHTVFEYLSDFIEGVIKGIEVRENRFNSRVQDVMLIFDDNKNDGVLTLESRSSYFRHFVQKISNLPDFSKPVKIRPYDFLPEGEQKRKRGLVISQGGTAIDWYFTKEEQHGCPQFQAPEGNYNDWPQDTQDDFIAYARKRERWFIDFMQSTIVPKFEANELGNDNNDLPPEIPGEIPVSPDEEPPEDDLPF